MGAVEGVSDEGVVGDAHRLVDGGGDVLGGDGVFDRVGGVLITGPVDVAGGHAAAGEEGGVAVGPVVPAVAVGAGVRGDLADLRGAAELSHGDDEGVFEQAPVVQVFNEGGEREVEHGEERLLEQGEVLAVGVPGLVVPGAGAEGDGADAGLDEPSGQEALLAQVRQAAELPGFFFPRVVGVEAVAFSHGR